MPVLSEVPETLPLRDGLFLKTDGYHHRPREDRGRLLVRFSGISDKALAAEPLLGKFLVVPESELPGAARVVVVASSS